MLNAVWLSFLLITKICFADVPAPVSYDYHLTAAVDPDVLADRATELWARIYAPATIAENASLPVIIIQHGNHTTCGIGESPRQDLSCEYTTDGTCPAGYVVVPNHLGYEYLANALVQAGFVVVSINANRGITCGEGTSDDPGLNMARGRLILKNLELLEQINAGTASGGPELAAINSALKSHLDFSHLGLIGHSRGGEGVRAAYDLLRDPQQNWRVALPGVSVGGIFELDPVDGQSLRVLNAEDTSWNVLLSACDGDVSDLEGITVFDRMSQEPTETNQTPKSAVVAWGLNHNGFNTEWQISDSMGCGNHIALFPMTMGSPEQQSVALQTVVPFMQAHLQGASPQAAQFFDPLYPIPAALSAVTTVERSHIPFINLNYANVLTDFTDDQGFSAKPKVSNVTVSSNVIPEQAPFILGAFTNWTRAGSDVSLEYDWATTAQTAFAVPTEAYLEFRVAATALSSTGPVDFSVLLVNADSSVTESVPISKYVKLLGPQGNHTLLQTVRIPFTDFASIAPGISGLRFVFDRSPNGGVVFANAYARPNYGAESPAPAPAVVPSMIAQVLDQPFALMNGFMNGTTLFRVAQPGGDAAQALAHIHAGSLISHTEPAAAASPIKLNFTSRVAFQAKDALLVLQAGDQTFSVSGFDSADLSAVHFTINAEQAALIPHGTPLTAFYRESGSSGETWNLGQWP